MSENLPATQDGPRQETDAERQRRRMTELMAHVEQRSDMLVTLLKETGISFDRFREVLRRAIIKGQENPNTNLLLADAGSVIQACIDACTAGLLPDGKQGAIVIYNQNVAGRGERKRYVKRAQFIPMYQGLLQLAYASRNFKDIQARVVYAVDAFDYELGIDPWIKHKPGARAALQTDEDGKPTGKRYEITHAYAVAKTVDGGVFLEVFEPEDIRKVMAVSRAKSGPAKDWPEEMARKGPLRRMWKFLPRNDRMDRVLELDDESYDLGDAEPMEERTEPALKRGFAPAAIAHEPSIPMETVTTEPQGEKVPVTEDTDEMPAHMREEVPIEPEEPTHAATDPEEETEAERPGRISEYSAKLDAAQSWLAVKQAVRSLYKAEDWDRRAWESSALTWAWDKYRELGDKTDFVTDVYLFAAWLAATEPDPERLADDFGVLQTQADWKRAADDVKDWVAALVAAATAEAP